MDGFSKRQCLFLNPTPFSSLFTFRLFRSEKASGDRTALAREGMSTQRAAQEESLSRMMP